MQCFFILLSDLNFLQVDSWSETISGVHRGESTFISPPASLRLQKKRLIRNNINLQKTC